MRPSLRTRLRAWLARAELDTRLAAGEKPSTPELRLRAAQLTEPNYLRMVAQKIDAIVDQANAHESGVLSFQRGEVVAALAPLLRLAERLREGAAPPTAAAVASQLVFSLRSPLYDATADSSVCELATQALALVDGEHAVDALALR
jgi:hypothetical protein